MSFLRLQPLEDRIVLDGAIAVDASAVVAAEPTSEPTHLVVVSDDVADSHLLEAAISNDDAVILHYDAEETDLNSLSQQIHDVLGDSKVHDVSFVTEGSEGIVNLVESDHVTLESLENTVMIDFFENLSSHILPEGNLNILGCNVAGNETGIALLEKLDGILDGIGYNIDVNASIDLTGHEELGGNWLLEYTTNNDITGPPVDMSISLFDAALLDQWNETLINDVITEVFRDLNFNDVKDPDDVGIEGVRVSIYDSTDLTTVLDTVLTDSNGLATFSGLTGGADYTLEYEIPLGHTIVTANQGGDDTVDSDISATIFDFEYLRSPSFTLPVNGTVTDVDAGFQYIISETYSVTLGDFVWEDVNENGVVDAGEPGVDGVTVTLLGEYDTGGGALQYFPLRTTTTPTDGLNLGDYEFSEIIPVQDTFDIIFILDVSGSTSGTITGASVGDVNNDGLSNTILDAELAAFASLSSELIQDGLDDSVRIGLVTFSSGATQIDLENDGNGDFDTLSPSDITDGTFNFLNGGNFQPGIKTNVIDNIVDGGSTNFDAALDVAIDYFNAIGTEPQNGAIVFLSDGANNGSNYTTEVNDLRDDGIQMRAIGVGGGANMANLEIIDPRAVQVFTEQDLLDYFADFLPFKLTGYALHYDAPPQYSFTDQDIGGDDTIDSDVDPTTGRTATFSVSANLTDNDFHAGLTTDLILDITKVAEDYQTTTPLPTGSIVETNQQIKYTVTISQSILSADEAVNIEMYDVIDPSLVFIDLDGGETGVNISIDGDTTYTADLNDVDADGVGLFNEVAGLTLRIDFNNLTNPITSLDLTDPNIVIEYLTEVLGINNGNPAPAPTTIVENTAKVEADEVGELGSLGLDPDFVFLIDVSGSMEDPFVGTVIGDYNGDGISDSLLDAELFSFANLAQQLADAVNAGSLNSADISLVTFTGSAATLNMNILTHTTGTNVLYEYSSPGTDLIKISAETDTDNNSTIDVIDILQKIEEDYGVAQAGGTTNGTNFQLAILEVIDAYTEIQTLQGGTLNGELVFLSDGNGNTPTGPEIAQLDALGVTDIPGDDHRTAIGLGTGADLSDLQIVDTEAFVVNDFSQLDDFFNIAVSGDTNILFCSDTLQYTVEGEPDLEIVKVFTDTTQSAVHPGDTILYTITITNNGTDTAENVVVTDTIDSDSSYVPNSMIITIGDVTGAQSDSAGDDLGTLIAANEVQFNLGLLATPLLGGALAPGETTQVTFEVTINSVPVGTEVTNIATVDYTDASDGTPLVKVSNPPTSFFTSIAGILVTPTTGLITTESGGQDTFTVVLDSKPSGNVVITLGSNDISEGSVDQNTLTFTPTDWDQPQTVTITGANDAIDDGDIAYAIVINSATSTDPAYDGLDPTDVSVTNLDNDTAGITVTPISGLETTELGGQATFSVVLDSEPLNPVTIDLSSTDTTEGTIDGAVGNNLVLTFDNTNWDDAQVVVLTGIDDDHVDGDIPYTIVLDPASSSDPLYNNLDPDNVSVTNLDDNDTAGITVVVGDGVLTNESGTQDTFTVQLDSRPAIGEVVVLDVIGTDPTEGTLIPIQLTFDHTNWDQPQTVTVTGVDDNFIDDDIVYDIDIVVNAGGTTASEYTGLQETIQATNEDNDIADLIIAYTGVQTQVETSEPGTTDTFTVALTASPMPGNNVVLRIISLDTSEGVVTTGTDVTPPIELIFDSTNWDQPQTVIVTGQDDPIDDGDITYDILVDAVPALTPEVAFQGLSGTVDAINFDDESAPTISISNEAQIESTSPMQFTVALSHPSSQTIEIPYYTLDGTAFAPGDYTALGSMGSPLTLTFNPLVTVQTINIPIINDNFIEVNETFSIVLGSPIVGDATYAGGGSTEVGTGTILNDDGLTVAISPTATPLSVIEGNTQDFTVTVTGDIEPGDTLTVTIEQATGTAILGSDLDYIGTIADPSVLNLQFTSGGSQIITVQTLDDAFDEIGPNQDYTLTITNAEIDNFTSPDLTITQDTSIGEIIDNEGTPVVFFTNALVQQVENITTMIFTVELSHQSESDITIDYSASDLTATAGLDYTLTPGTLTFLSGDTSEEIVVTILNDTFVENNETFEVILEEPTPNGAAVLEFGGTTLAAVGEIINDDSMVVTIQNPVPNPDNVTEGNSQQYDVVVSGATFDPNDSLEVVLDLTGITATIPDDLTGVINPTNTLIFDDLTPNQTITVTIPTIDDQIVENSETYTLSILSATLTNTNSGLNETLDNSSSETGTILDNDSAGFTIIPPVGGTLQTSEPNVDDSFSVVLDNIPEGIVTLTFLSSDTTEVTVPVSVTFDSSDWNIPKLITVTGIDDFLVDGTVPYTITVGIDPASDPLWTGLSNQIIDGDHADDDSAALVIDLPNGAQILHTEDETTDFFTVALSAQPDPGEVVYVDITSNDPSEGNLVPAQLIFDENNWNIPQQVDVTGEDDPIFDGDIGFTIDVDVNNTLTTDTSFLGLNTVVPALNIDNENPPTITFVGEPFTAVEGDPGDTNQVIFTVELSHPSAFVVEIPYMISSGTAVSGVDFVDSSGTLLINNLDTQGQIVVDIIEDLFVEADETFTLILDTPTNAVYDQGAASINTTGTIENDDQLLVSISDAIPGTQIEGGQQSFEIAVTGGDFDSGDELVVTFQALNGTAQESYDFELVTTLPSVISPLSFTATGTETILVNILDDPLFEPGANENYTIEIISALLNGSSTDIVITQNQGIGEITDNDTAPTINFNPVDASELEGNTTPANEILFTIELSNPTTEALFIPIFTTDITANENIDYLPVNTTLQIAGSTDDNFITSAQVAVVLVPDLFAEPDETFTLTLQNPTVGQGTIGTNGEATGTIINDDEIDISIQDGSVTEEDNGPVEIIVDITLSSPPEGVTEIYFETVDGTATAGLDYTAIPQTIATFDPNGPNITSFPITLEILPDQISEGTEEFYVDISFVTQPDPSADIEIIKARGVITIIDDDGTPTISIVTPDAILEGDSGTKNYHFNVILSRPSANPITVTYETTPGTATANDDYTEPNPVQDQITFAAGETSKTITIEVLGDLILEDNETFFIDLLNVTAGNATISQNQSIATGVIINDDAVPTVSVNDVLQNIEGSSPPNTTTYTFTIELSHLSDDDIIVEYQTLTGSAIDSGPNADFTPITSAFTTITAGTQSVDVDVDVIQDTRFEDNETFFLKLIGVTGTATIADETGEAIINNDDSGQGTDLITQVWIDVDGDGIFDPSFESGLEGVTVELVATDGNGNPVVVIQSTTTNSFGEAEFLDIKSAGDTYLLRWEHFDFFEKASNITGDPLLNDNDNDAVVNITSNGVSFTRSNEFIIDEGQQILNVDAGFIFYDDSETGGATISNIVWNDLNHNGIQDGNEPGIEGVVVNLYANELDLSGSNDVLVRTTVTNANGEYSFDNLPGTTDLFVSNSGTIIFVVDLSTSAENNQISGVDIVDAELAAFEQLVNQINNLGIGNITEIGIVGFGATADAIDWDPGTGIDYLTTADDPSLITTLQNLSSNLTIDQNGSNYSAALDLVNTILNPLANPTQTSVIMLTDGLPTGPDFTADVTTLQGLASNIKVYGLGDAGTFALTTLPSTVPSEQGNSHNPVETTITLDRFNPVDLDITVLQNNENVTQPLDIYFLQDATASHENDFANFSTNFQQIINTLINYQSNGDVNAGLGIFRDKPLEPFGYDDDFVFRNRYSIASMNNATNVTDLQNIIDSVVASGGGDLPEGTLEALFHAAISLTPNTPDSDSHSTGIFRDAALKVIVISTDADAHLPPDGINGNPTITSPNNGNSTINAFEDYPTIAQLIDVLNLNDSDIANDITPLFLVTENEQTFFENIVAQLGIGEVELLSGDSSNIATAIQEGIADIISDLRLEVLDDDFGLIPLSGTNPDPNNFPNTPVGTQETFTVNFTLDPTQEVYGDDTITIASDTIGGLTTVNVLTENALTELQIIDDDAFMINDISLLNNIFSGLASANDPDGAPNFPSSYFVEFIQPEGFVLTAQDVGGDDTVDSDADQVTEKTDPFLLNAGETNDTIDAGMALPVISISSPVAINEGDSGTTAFPFVITVEHAGKWAIEVNYSTNDGTALVSDNDYQQTLAATASFAGVTPGGPALTETIFINAVGDLKYEQDETFNVQLFNPTNAVIDQANKFGDATIINDDNAPTVSIVPINANSFDQEEGIIAQPLLGDILTSAGIFDFKIILSNPSYEDITIDFFTMDGAAIENEDYTPVNTSVTILSGNTETDTLTIDAIADNIFENNEEFTLNLGSITGDTTAGGTDQSTLTIINDDNAPVIQIDSQQGLEGTPGISPPSVLTFTITKIGQTAFDIDFTVNINEGTALILPGTLPATEVTDYIVTNGPDPLQLTIGANDTEETVTVVTRPDFMHELDETFTVELVYEDNPNYNGPDDEIDFTESILNGLGIIENDDAPPTVSIVPATDSVLEGTAQNNTLEFDIILSHPSFEDITVFARTLDGTGIIDFQNLLAPAQTPDGQGQNDYMPIDGINPLATFLSGDEGAQTFSITTVADSKFEFDELFNVEITQVTGSIGNFVEIDQNNGSFEATILNDDAKPTLVLTAPVNINEETDVLGTPTIYSFTLERQGATAFDIELTTDTELFTGIGAQAFPTTDLLTDNDFFPIINQMNTILASSDASVVVNAFVEVGVVPDNKFELNELFTVVTTATENSLIGNTNSEVSADATIINDDAEPILLIDDVILDEGAAGGNTFFTFTVTLSNPTYENVVTGYTTADNTALVSDNDYLPILQGPELTFDEGVLTDPNNPVLERLIRTITVEVLEDNKYELPESFYVNLHPTNGNVDLPFSDLQGEGTILNDDPMPTIIFTPGGAVVEEGDSGLTPVPVTIELSNPTYQDLTLTLGTEDGGTALPPAIAGGSSNTGGDDYEALITQLFIPSNSLIATTTLYINGDTTIEPSEIFSFIITQIESTNNAPAEINSLPPDFEVIILNNDVDNSFFVISPEDDRLSLLFDYNNEPFNKDHILSGILGRNDFPDFNIDYLRKPFELIYGSAMPPVIISELFVESADDEKIVGWFEIYLSLKPDATVTIPLDTINMPEGSLSTNEIVFEPDEWQEVKKVYVIASPEIEVDGDKTQIIVTDPAISTDGNFEDYDPQDLNINEELKDKELPE